MNGGDFWGFHFLFTALCDTVIIKLQINPGYFLTPAEIKEVGDYMGEKDLTEKTLEDHNDVFSDIMNGFLFHGKEVVHQDEVADISVHSQYKADDARMHELERDVVKYWKPGNVEVAVCGLENQTGIERNLPFRVIGYDGASYRAQLLSDAERRPKNMCDVAERLEQRGIQKGIQKGIQEGLTEKGIRVYWNMIDRGFSPEDAQAVSELTDAEVQEAAEWRRRRKNNVDSAKR